MRALVVAVFIAVSLAAPPQTPASDPRPPFTSAHGAFIALSVADLDASAHWYHEKLGLAIVKARSQSPDGKSFATILSGNQLIVELIQHSDAVALQRVDPNLTRAYQVHGIFKSGLVVDDLDATLKELEARGVNVAFSIFRDDALAYRTFAVRDNAGNFLQFFGK